MPEWLVSQHLLGLPLWHWLRALAVVLGGYAIVLATAHVIASRLRRLDQAHPNPLLGAVADSLQRTSRLLILLLFVLLGAELLQPLAAWSRQIANLAFAAGGLQVGLWLHRAVATWTHRSLEASIEHGGNPVVRAMTGWFARILVWATVGLAILANMGVNITAFVASLGVGGVAVALALQNVLGDLFASLSIGLDKPFEIGNFVVFGDIAGTIERVGVKTTRIRSLSGEQVILGNADLLRHTVHNYGRMQTRRIVFAFGVTYDTERSRLAAIPRMVGEIIGAIDGVQFDRAHFKAFGASSLDFEVVYTVLDADYNRYMDVQQQINLALVERFDAEGIGFAFPSRTLYVAGMPRLQLDRAAATGSGSA